MSLYDDLGLDGIREKPEQVAGWSSGIKLLQSQLQLKKTSQIQQHSQPKRDHHRRPGTVLAPVIDLKKSRRFDDDEPPNTGFGNYGSPKVESRNSSAAPSKSSGPSGTNNNEQEWVWDDEYDPTWPNDYEKVVKDLRDKQDREREIEEDERKRRGREDRDRKGRESVRSRYDEDRRKAGFAGRPESDEEEEDTPKPSRGGGVAIAPPPSLQETSNNSPKRPSFSGESYGMMGGSSVAAKIMAKYGFKEGQGLGKKEQGIAMALQVEKTSKRGGRIISDKDTMSQAQNMNPAPDLLSMAPPGMSMSPPPPAQNLFNAMPPPSNTPDKPEPSITEMMKNPSKAVLLRNMVGPGEVDEDLEPEVKDECNTKYGDVIKVIIFEVPNVPSDEAVRIFVEFKRIESAIKAVVDLNGRFFGGRQVKAGFYSCEKLNNLELL